MLWGRLPGAKAREPGKVGATGAGMVGGGVGAGSCPGMVGKGRVGIGPGIGFCIPEGEKCPSWGRPPTWGEPAIGIIGDSGLGDVACGAHPRRSGVDTRGAGARVVGFGVVGFGVGARELGRGGRFEGLTAVEVVGLFRGAAAVAFTSGSFFGGATTFGESFSFGRALASVPALAFGGG